jgi:hypothetical protein
VNEPKFRSIWGKPLISISIPDRNAIFPAHHSPDFMPVYKSENIKLTNRYIKYVGQSDYKEEGYSHLVYLSLDEWIIYIIAHELQHHFQHFAGFVKGIDFDKLSDADSADLLYLFFNSFSIIR